MSVLRENIIHITVNFLSDIVRYKCKLYIELFVRARLKKRKEKKWKCYGLITGRQKSLSRPDFSFRCSLKHRNTDPRNRNL